MKPTRKKKPTVKRSQSSFSLLSSYHRDEKSSYPFIKIVGNNESIGFDFGTILKVKEASQDDPSLNERNVDEIERSELSGDQTDETKIIMKSREESLEEIRGILTDQLPGTGSVRRIHFSLIQPQCPGDQLEVPGIRRRLRSPPPFLPDLLTPFNEGNNQHTEH